MSLYTSHRTSHRHHSRRAATHYIIDTTRTHCTRKKYKNAIYWHTGKLTDSVQCTYDVVRCTERVVRLVITHTSVYHVFVFFLCWLLGCSSPVNLLTARRRVDIEKNVPTTLEGDVQRCVIVRRFKKIGEKILCPTTHAQCVKFLYCRTRPRWQSNVVWGRSTF